VFYFVIPLRSAETTKNWPLTCRFLGRTLRNLSAQRSQNWRVVLVCSERPDIPELDFVNVSTCQVNFPIPRDLKERRRDKSGKLAVGVEIAFQQAAAETDTIIMPVDADDLLSVRLVEFAEAKNATNGFVLSRGYLHASGSRVLWTHNRFHTLCGSCTAFRIRGRDRLVFADAAELIDLLNQTSHGYRDISMAERGTPFVHYPLRGAVYSLSTSDNHSGNRLGFKWKPWRMAWISSRLQDEFPGLC
jgi:hypothetical protein